MICGENIQQTLREGIRINQKDFVSHIPELSALGRNICLARTKEIGFYARKNPFFPKF